MSGHKHIWWLASGVFVMVLAQAMSPPLAHAEDELQVSSDARHWQSNLDRPLFEPDRRWVPGDSETTTFWIRNTADSAGDLQLIIDPVEHDQLLRDGLQIRARTAAGVWIRLAADGSPRRIAGTLRSGAMTQVWITTSFAPKADNRTQDGYTDLDVRIRLSQHLGPGDSGTPGHSETPADSGTPGNPGTPGAPGGPGSSANPGELAGTGTDGSEVLLLVGAAAVGVGVAMLRPSRRRKQGSRS